MIIWRGRGYKALSANFGDSPHFRCHLGPRWWFKKNFLKLLIFGIYWPKNSQICPNTADLVQKVGFTAIIHYFDLHITPYGLFSMDNYKLKTLQALNFSYFAKKCLKLPKINTFSINSFKINQKSIKCVTWRYQVHFYLKNTLHC